MEVVRVYHAGRDAAHRERDRALHRAGVRVRLIVPTSWPETDSMTDEPFEVVELPVLRPGSVNRHRYVDASALATAIGRPTLLDLHEEPFSAVTHQALTVTPRDLPVIGYTAQNLDKRFPPPYWLWERQALGRMRGLYPCSRQAASVAAGKGFRGAMEVIPLGTPAALSPGDQTAPGDAVRLLLVGRMVPEKGVVDAVRLLTRLPGARLHLVGDGPALAAARTLAAAVGAGDRLEVSPWLDSESLATAYRSAHILLAPSQGTRSWVEQFGRMATEAQACGTVVVGHASGSLPEVIGRAGVVVPEGDENALLAAIRRICAEPGTWAQLREAGLVAARARTWDAVAARQIDLYERSLRAVAQGGVARPNRRTARAAWGEPAVVDGVRRPVALPPLPRRTAPAPSAPARPKVVFLDHVARLSGGEIALLRLIPAIPNIDAHVILAEDGPLREALGEAGIGVEILPIDPEVRDLRRTDVGAFGAGAAAVGAAGYALRLASRLRELQPDVVHANSLKSGFYGGAAARLAGVPLVWHVRDRLVPDYLPPRAVRLARTAVWALARVAIAPSQAVRSTLPSHQRVLVLPDPYAAPQTPARSPGTDGPVVAMIGRISAWKGQDVFLDAIALLRPDHPDLRARIIGAPMFGEEELDAGLRARADDAGLGDVVSFVGFSPDVPAELSRLTILVHASTLPEPFGQVIIEGMAAGVPVVVSNAGGAAEIVEDGLTGLLVPQGDPEALAAALARLLGDHELRERLAAAGSRRARDFVPEAVGPRVRALYEEILG